MTGSKDETKFNETLTRMLGTQPKPHDDSKAGPKSVKARKVTGAQERVVDESRKSDKN
jgi:hypothetical protein